MADRDLASGLSCLFEGLVLAGHIAVASLFMTSPITSWLCFV